METTKDLCVGQFVKSKAGRDKDRMFIILEIVDDNYLKLADGDLRKVENAKQKKVRHVAPMKIVSDDIRQKTEEGKKITNLMLRREIEKLGLGTPL